MKTRALISILIAILTGFALGYLVAVQIGHWKFKDVKSMSSTEAFRMRAFSIIEPSPDQEKQIIPIIDKYSIIGDSLKKECHKTFEKFFEEYNAELEPFLSEEQIERLYKFPKHRK